MKKGTTKKPAAKAKKFAKLSKKLEVLQRDINQQLAEKAAKAKAKAKKKAAPKKKVAAKKKSY